MSASTSKAVLEHSNGHLATRSLRLLSYGNSTVEQLCQRLCSPQSLKYLLSDPLQKKSANPCQDDEPCGLRHLITSGKREESMEQRSLWESGNKHGGSKDGLKDCKDGTCGQRARHGGERVVAVLGDGRTTQEACEACLSSHYWRHECEAVSSALPSSTKPHLLLPVDEIS